MVVRKLALLETQNGPGVHEAQLRTCLVKSGVVGSIAGPDQIDVTVGPNATPGRRLLADSTTTVAVVLHPTEQQVRWHARVALQAFCVLSFVLAVNVAVK
jgi:hypothetical protein